MMRGMAVPTTVWSSEASSRDMATPAVAMIFCARDRFRVSDKFLGPPFQFLYRAWQIVKDWMSFWQVHFIHVRDELEAQVPHLGELLGREARQQALLPLGGARRHPGHPLMSGLGQAGQDGPAVGRVGDPDHEAVALQVVDEAGHVARADVHAA